jgi:5-bromo-4-chloroindolyl phosphate hydrolysis protein
MSKAKRYQPFHPKKKNSFKNRQGHFLYLFLAPLSLAIILALLQRDIGSFILNIIAFGLFFATAKINSIGLSNEYEYHTKTLTKAPKIPFKTIAAILLGISTLFTATVAGERSILTGTFLAIVSTIGHYLYYGTDPKEDKIDNIGDISAQFVIETLSEARAKLSSIETDISYITDTELYSKLKIATNKGYEIIDTIEDDPKDLRVARKFIIVYIDGIKKVTQSYTSIDEEEITSETKKKLSNLLFDIEERFEKEIKRLKKNNQFDLDVNIEVLQKQIKN